MNARTIQYQASRFINQKGKPFELLNDESRINALRSGGPVTLIGATNEAKAIQARSFASGNEDVFARKLPAVGHLTLLAHMALIAVEKVNEPVLRQVFQFMEGFEFVGVPLRAGLFSPSSSYAFVSSAKLFKRMF
jgi:hypothetical protein